MCFSIHLNLEESYLYKKKILINPTSGKNEADNKIKIKKDKFNNHQLAIYLFYLKDFYNESSSNLSWLVYFLFYSSSSKVFSFFNLLFFIKITTPIIKPEKINAPPITIK